MIDIALVSYINTRPFMDGFEHNIKDETIRFHLLPPAECAHHLLKGNCQMALIPVGALVNFEKIAILPNYCIGGNGPVESVFLFAQQPIETLETVILDRHSRSSNGLARILLRHHWNKQVFHPMAKEKHFDQIKGNTGGVVIGDQAIRIRDQYKYAYDLSDEWKNMTGLSFPFAVWAYHPGSFSSFQLKQLDEAMKWGVKHAAESAKKWADHYQIPKKFAQHYLNNCIDFYFDTSKHKALKLYLKALKNLPELELQAV